VNGYKKGGTDAALFINQLLPGLCVQLFKACG
jgi:hypothetical protein